MFMLIPLSMLAFFATCLAVAAWPLLISRRARPALLGVTGSGCVLAGALGTALVATGFVGPAEYASRASAQEEATAPAVLEKDAELPQGADAPRSPSPQPPVPSPQPPSSDPVLESPRENSVIIPPGRPRWVEDDPQTAGSGVHTVPVSSGPHTRHSDAIKYLHREIEQAASEYVADYLGSDLAPAFLRYDANTIRTRFVKPENVYEEEIIVSVGPMQQAHALIEFTPGFRDELDREWARVRATSRLGQLGLFAVSALLLLGSIFSYFRLDNATRGYYTGRLQFMAAAAILAVVAGGALAARWITWL